MKFKRKKRKQKRRKQSNLMTLLLQALVYQERYIKYLSTSLSREGENNFRLRQHNDHILEVLEKERELNQKLKEAS